MGSRVGAFQLGAEVGLAVETNGGHWASGQFGNFFSGGKGDVLVSALVHKQNQNHVVSGKWAFHDLTSQLYFNFVLHEVKLDPKPTSVDCFLFFSLPIELLFVATHFSPLFVMFSDYVMVQRHARACWDALALLNHSQQHTD